MPSHIKSHIPGHIKVGPNHKNTQGVSRDAGVAQNLEKIPISISPSIPDDRFPSDGSFHNKSTPIGSPGNI